ncbi:MAG: hypothetical protein L0Z73_17900, partial [Gammaproteobacteria bacterium]|nr:hypothetical protein [Gammaproteobacteria bacterium]
MSTHKILVSLVSTVLAVCVGSVGFADDTELYTNNTSVTPGAPLVMFSIDYLPNVLGSKVCQDEVISGETINPCASLVSKGYLASTPVTRIEYLKAVMKAALDEFSGIRIGLMISHDNKQGCAGPGSSGCSGGAYILKGIGTTELSTKTYAEGDPVKKEFIDLLGNLGTKGGNTAHPFQGKEIFFEFFRYLTGQNAYSSHLGWTDYGTDATTNLSSETDKYQLMRDISIEGKVFKGGTLTDSDKLANMATYNSPGKYISPITENCSKIFTVNFSFGVTANDSDADTAIQASFATGGMDVSLTGTSDSVNTLLKFLNQNDFADGTWGADKIDKTGKQNVTSFWIVEAPDGLSGRALDNVLARYDSWAAAGGTTAAYQWSDNPDDLIQSIKIILNQILSVSTTFTAA